MDVNENQERVYINIPAAFVKENLTNKQTGQSFHIATMPKNTIVDGKDVGGYQFSPMFVNKPFKFNGNQIALDDNNEPIINETSKMRVIPMKADSEVWLQNNKTKDKVIASPQTVKDALKENMKLYRAEQKEKNQEIDEQTFDEVQDEMVFGANDMSVMSKDDIPLEMPNLKANKPVKDNKPKIKPPNELRSYATQKATELNSGKEKPAQAKSQGLKQ